MSTWRIKADSAEQRAWLRDWRTKELLALPFGGSLNVKFACFDNGELVTNLERAGAAITAVDGKHVIDEVDALVGEMPNGEVDFFTDNDFHGDLTFTGNLLTAPRGIYRLVLSAWDSNGNTATYAFGKVRIV